MDLDEELRSLAEALATSEDIDVIDCSRQYAEMFTLERQTARMIASIRSITSEAVHEVIDLDNHPAVTACAERLRDRLRALLAWARETGRME